MKKGKQPAKQVVVIARISWKYEPKVCYLVRASKPLKDGEYTLKPRGVVEFNGETFQSIAHNGERYLIYQVCFLNGKIAGCQCPAQGTCYHKTQLIALEQKRQNATPVMSPQIIETPMTISEAVVIDTELEELLAVVEAQHASHGLKTLPGASQTVTNNLTTARPPDVGSRGTLNGASQGFSLMRR